MRITFCVRSHAFAGVERYIAYVAPELFRRGWDVTVLGGEETRMQRELRGVPFLRAATTREVFDQLRRTPSDLVHTHMTAAEVAAVIDQRLHRWPLVTTRHFAANRGSTRPARLVGRFVFRSLSAQISISRFVAEKIHEPSVVILNGVPAVDVERTPRPQVLIAQRLEPEKSTEVALSAWARSSLPKRGWKLLIAGDGQERQRLEARASRLQLGRSVEFLGHRADMSLLMGQSSVLLAPAPAEPFGFSVAEAMATGLPVVAAAGGAHPETVGAVREDWLFPPGDAEAAACALDALCEEDGLREEYGAALRSWQRQHLSVLAHVDQLEALYRQVLR